MNITLVLIIIICCIIICILAMKNKKNNEIIERYGNVIDKKTSVTNEQREELNKYEWLLNKNVKGNEYIQNIVKNKDGDIIIVVIQEISFLNMAIKYDNYMNDSQDTFVVCLMIALVIGLTLVVVIVIILSAIFNDIKQLKKEIELIEYVKAEEENEN